MQHLDEGTIHAWIDGALDAAQSAEIESHIATCGACSAAVAEARGLVAGASRILNALDDVPANVMPKRAPLARPRRQWRAAPWVTGIAAALMLAIGLTQVRGKGEKRALVSSESVPVAASTTVVDSVGSKVVAPETPPVSAPSRPSRPSSAANTAPAIAAGGAADQSLARRDRARSEPTVASDFATAGALKKEVGQETRLRAGAVAGAATQAAPAAPSVQDAASQRLQSMQSQKLEQVVVTAAPEAIAPAALERAAKAGADAAAIAGCYRVQPQAREVREGVARRAGAAVGRAAAPSAADSRAASSYVAAMPPEVVRLDTTRHPTGYIVRSERSDSSIGSWQRIGTDSARVDLLGAGLFQFALADRVICRSR
jgi:hypothetical protein